MAFNLLELLKGQIGEHFRENLASQLDANPDQVHLAIKEIAPSILMALVNKASQGYGAKEILDQIRRHELDSNTISDVKDALTSEYEDDFLDVLNLGEPLVKNIFGGKIGNIARFVSEHTGVESATAENIFNVFTPLIMGVLGKEVSSNGLDATGLKTLLLGQKDLIKDLVPEGMNFFTGMGITDEHEEEEVDPDLDEAQQMFTSTEEEITDHVRSVQKEMDAEIANDINIDGVPPEFGIRSPRSSKSRRLRKSGDSLLQKTVVASAFAILGVFVFTTFFSPSPVEVIEFQREEEFKTRGGTAAEKAVNLKLRDGYEMSVGKSSVEERMVNFIKNYDPKLKDMPFRLSGNILKPDSEQLANIAAILEAYPKVNVEILGNASMASDLQLLLIKQGISAARIGLGSKNSDSDLYCTMRLLK